MSDHDHEHDPEPVLGLPEALPDGERILWQGTPRWQAMARHVFHVRALAVYFVALLAWRGIATLQDGGGAAAAAMSVAWLAPLALAALGIVALIAWLNCRATVYTVTNRRVVMRIGIVLTLTFNLPFRVIESAGLRRYGDGSGDIALTLSGEDRIAYLHLWPHARPWQFSRPQPMLRAVPDAQRVAEILSRAVAAVPGAAVAHIPDAANEPDGAGADAGSLVAAR